MGILSDPIAMKYYPNIFDEAGTTEWIQRHLDRYSTHGIGLWVAESKENGEFIGQIGLSPIEVEGQKDVEIGYILSESTGAKVMPLKELWHVNNMLLQS